MTSDFCPICRKHVLEYRDAVLEREAMRKERDAAVEALSDRRDQQLEGFLEVEQANNQLQVEVARLRKAVALYRAHVCPVPPGEEKLRAEVDRLSAELEQQRTRAEAAEAEVFELRKEVMRYGQ